MEITKKHLPRIALLTIIAAAVMIGAGLLPHFTAKVYADKVVASETIETDQQLNQYEGDYFKITCTAPGPQNEGFYLGENGVNGNPETATITCKDWKQISRVDLMLYYRNGMSPKVNGKYSGPNPDYSESPDGAHKYNVWYIFENVNAATATLTAAAYGGNNYVSIKKVRIYYEAPSVDLDSSLTLAADENVKALTATLRPENHTGGDETVKWSVTEGSDKIKLYSDSSCNTEIGTAATSTKTVYVKRLGPLGTATVKVERNDDSTRSDTCNVYVRGTKLEKPNATFEASGYDEGTLSGVSSDMVYRINYSTSGWSSISGNTASLTGLSRATTNDIQVKRPGNGTTTEDSDIQLIELTRGSKPNNLSATDCTSAANNDGKITGVTTAMEYQKSDATGWTPVTGTEITGLTPGDYYVRTKASGTQLASANSNKLTIKRFVSYTVTFKVINGSWNEGTGDEAKADKTEPVGGVEGTALKLSDDQIPGVGNRPDADHKAGSWDVTPNTSTVITENTTYKYTYEAKTAITPSVSLEGWTYGEAANEPSVTGNTGNGQVSYTYYTDSACNTKTTTENSGAAAEGGQPVNAGPYYIKASIAETDDYASATTAATAFTIAKAENPGIITDSAIVKRGGNEVDLSNNVTDAEGNVSYAITEDTTVKEPGDKECALSDSVLVSGDKAGTCTVTVTIAGNTNYKEKTGEITVTVTEKDTGDLAVTQSDGQYGGEALADPNYTRPQDPVTDAVISYSGTTRAGETYGSSDKKPTQAGTYVVSVTEETKTTIYTGTAKFKIDPVRINDATVAVGGSYTYNGSPQVPKAENVTVTLNGTELGAEDYTFAATNNINSTTNESKAIVTVTGSGNYDGTATGSFDIAKADPEVTAPTPKDLTYSGEDQGLVDPGKTTGGTLQYAEGKESSAPDADADWSTAIPKATGAGKYCVWYRVKGDNNYNDSEAKSVTVNIDRKDVTVKAADQLIMEGESIKTGIDQATLSGAARGHSLSAVTLTANAGKIVPSDAKIKDAAGSDVTNNYKITYQPGALAVINKDSKKEELKPTTPTDPTPTPVKKISGTELAKMKTEGDNALVLSWSKINGAKGYDIFFGKCGKKAAKKVKTIKGNKTFQWTKTGLKAETAYKAYVKAWVMKDGKKKYVKKSPLIHAYTSGSSKLFTNAKSVTVKKKNVSLRLDKKYNKKTYKIKARVNKLVKGKKLMPRWHANKLRYRTSNPDIAKVSSSGKITAVGKGKCKVYVFAHNGVGKTIKVTVR